MTHAIADASDSVSNILRQFTQFYGENPQKRGAENPFNKLFAKLMQGPRFDLKYDAEVIQNITLTVKA